jgi:hypothetical protein
VAALAAVVRNGRKEPRVRVLLAAVPALVAAAAALAEPARFASAVEDLPLMSGLVEEGAAPFETPAGRIVRVEAEGPVTAGDVTSFYRETLPALGWRRLDATDLSETLAFVRAGERLGLRIEPQARMATRVTFMITPMITSAGAAAAR